MEIQTNGVIMNKENKYLAAAKLIRLLLVLATALISIMAVLKADRLGGMEVFLFLLSGVPISLLTNLYGFITGMVCFSLIFVCCAFASPEQAYFAAYYLLAVLQTNFLMGGLRKRGWFRAILMFLFSALFMGSFFYLVYYGIGGRSMLTFNPFYLLISVGLLIPVTVLTGLCARLLPKLAPEKLKRCFRCLVPSAHGALKEGDFRYLRSLRSISGQLTLVLAGEALVLALGGAVFSNILMPGMGKVLIERRQPGEQPPALQDPAAREMQPAESAGAGDLQSTDTSDISAGIPAAGPLGDPPEGIPGQAQQQPAAGAGDLQSTDTPDVSAEIPAAGSAGDPSEGIHGQALQQSAAGAGDLQSTDTPDVSAGIPAVGSAGDPPEGIPGQALQQPAAGAGDPGAMPPGGMPAGHEPPPPGMRPSLLDGMVDYLDTVEIISREDAENEFVLNDDALAFDLKLILLLFSTAFPLVTLANYFIQRRIAMPIVLLADKANDFAMGNEEERASTARELDELPMKKRRDEIGILQRSIRSTFREINEYVEKLREEQRLKEDLEVARRANEAKSSFLSNMSHEIRTPINAVLGLDEMILRESTDPRTLAYATDIKNSGKSLLSLVNDILDFSKIEAGKLEILPVEYELSSVINDLVNMIRIKAEEKGLELKIEVDPALPHLLYGDEVRLKQCVLNILTNAVKYTEKGSVTLRVGFARLSDEEISLSYQVADTGIGIREEDLVKLYSPFERIEEVRNRTIEGTGLGMSIVKNLLAMMGTQLNVKSVYGEGSDFSFAVTQRVIKWEAIGNFAETYRRTAGKAGVYHEKLKAPDALILITDDTPMNLTVAKGLLKRTEIRVDTAVSGEETLEKIKETHYDAIFIDHRMPKMDGIETLHAMEGLPGSLNRDTPCIALTANAVSGAREMYLEAGFADYLSKPIDGEKLETMLIRYLPAEKVQLTPAEGGQGEAAAKAGGQDAAAPPGRQGAEAEGDPGQQGAKPEAALGQPAPVQEGASRKQGAKLEGASGLSANGQGEDSWQQGAEAEGDPGQQAWYPGLDHAAGLANCMTEEILEAAIQDFRDSLAEKPALIEKLLENGDIRGYVTEVHALKSSARLIGASELSKMAEELELAGDAGKEELLKEKTPALLELYLSYREKLALPGADAASAGGAPEAGQEALPELPPEQLEEAYTGIREFADAFDFDSALGILDMLADYALPEEERAREETLRRALRAGDRAEALRLLEEGTVTK